AARTFPEQSPCRVCGTTAGWKCARWVHYCHAVWVNEVGLAEWCCVPDEKSLTGALPGITVCGSRCGKHEEQNLCTLGAHPAATRGDGVWTYCIRTVAASMCTSRRLWHASSCRVRAGGRPRRSAPSAR